MIAHFPSPILSVAADVVQDLEGEDALYGLWTLFTKCKESLKDGRRLENISWRLWYREIAASHHSPYSSSDCLSPPLCEKRSPSPVTPTSEDGRINHQASSPQALLNPAADVAAARSWHGDASTSSLLPASRRLSTASMPMARPQAKPHNSVGVGKLILEILPGKLDVPAGRIVSNTKQDVANSKARPPPVPKIVQPRPLVATPTVQLPSGSSTSTPIFPRVVVVNPTPHPTPPATPNIPRGSSVLHSAPAHASTHIATHLVPPQSTRTMVMAPPATPAKPPAPSPAPPLSSRDPMARPSGRGDETIKASDRRFFLQETDSPERESPDSSARTGAGKTSDGHELSPSSATSSQMSQIKSDGAGAAAGLSNKRGAIRAQGRKSKEVVRQIPARPGIHRTHTSTHLQRQAAQRKAANGDAKKAAFNIGSVSSNGSRNAVVGPAKPVQKQPVAQKPPPSPPKHTNGAVQPPRRGIVVSTSSEYETDTDDDSEWASEDNSTEEREKERQREEIRIREAAEEAQRQRDMFAKVPRRSYTNLQTRTRSGLLSQLLNPDPNLFPPNHPYRTYSSQDMTQFGRQGGPPKLPMSKSTVAVPLAAQVTAQAPPTDGSSNANANANANANGGYRKKGRPQGEELEDDSDSGDESPDNAIQLSRSLAQQKLAALADPSRRRHSDKDMPPPEPPIRPAIPSVATAPIPLTHPYNLPAPAPPMTPRTTRRQMLSTELSESLRRNLLWERQVSKINMTSGARRGGLLGNGLRPLTAVHGETSARNGAQHGAAPKSGDGNEAKDEQTRSSMARNRSGADDYHYAGW
ncbi:hypothetical protein AcW1_007960 [Taiwanofungus camphoratus]|nr:hypothetical protein AcW1_007960 [Antrodia cinnamomea]